MVGSAPGQDNTRFVSDVRVVNTSNETRTVTLEFFQGSPTGLSAASAVEALTIAPGAEAVIDDDVDSQFDLAGLGALKFTASGSVTSGVRVFNDQRPVDGGTTSFFVPPRSIATAKTSGVLPFLSNAGAEQTRLHEGFRTNVGWFNPSLLPAGVMFRAHRASDGTVLGSVESGSQGSRSSSRGSSS